MLPITSGRILRPQRTVIYGVEGIGKSTMAASWPSPLFLDTEDSTAEIDVPRIPVSSMQEFRKYVKGIINGEADGFRTIVLDTADWMFDLCADEAARELKVPDVSQVGYGQGYALASRKFDEVLESLDAILREKRMHIVVVAHAMANKVEMPGEQPYQQWSIKIRAGSGTVSKLGSKLREWADHVLFMNWNTAVIEGVGVSGKEAKIYTRRAAAYEAKNRCNLPDILERNPKAVAPIWQLYENTLNTATSASAPASAPSTPQVAQAPAQERRNDPVPPSGSAPEELGYDKDPVQKNIDLVLTYEQQQDAISYLNSRGKQQIKSLTELPKAVLDALLTRPADLLKKIAQWKGGQQ